MLSTPAPGGNRRLGLRRVPTRRCGHSPDGAARDTGVNQSPETMALFVVAAELSYLIKQELISLIDEWALRTAPALPRAVRRCSRGRRTPPPRVFRWSNYDWARGQTSVDVAPGTATLVITVYLSPCFLLPPHPHWACYYSRRVCGWLKYCSCCASCVVIRVQVLLCSVCVCVCPIGREIGSRDAAPRRRVLGFLITRVEFILPSSLTVTGARAVISNPCFAHLEITSLSKLFLWLRGDGGKSIYVPSL